MSSQECGKSSCHYSVIRVWVQALLILVLRLYVGWGFIESALHKFQDIEGTVKFFTLLGIPFPYLSVLLSGGAELICGALLLVGFFARLASIPLIITMSVAYITAHRDSLVHIVSNPEGFIQQAPFLLLLTSLLVFAYGPGRISIDYLFCTGKNPSK